MTCDQCKKSIVAYTPHTTGRVLNAETGECICYSCCAIRDRQTMIEKGHSRNLPLYWDRKKITNWPGSLVFQPLYTRKGKHNIAGTREDVWFNGPDGHVWHGVHIGDFNTILHARRTKERTKAVA